MLFVQVFVVIGGIGISYMSKSSVHTKGLQIIVSCGIQTSYFNADA